MNASAGGALWRLQRASYGRFERSHHCEGSRIVGERSQALRVYRRFADKMREELDAEPDDETTAFFEKLQTGASV